jgi:hypothetical protein
MPLSDFERERRVKSFREQVVDDERVIEDLGLAALVYGWRRGRPAEPLPFLMGHHAWELYRLPEVADSVARAVLARTSRRAVHWLVDWPGRDRVLLRRPSTPDAPCRGGWANVRRDRRLEQRLRDSVEAVARLDRTLERVEVLEPLYVEHARLDNHDWTRTVALLCDGMHIAICPWDWYEFIVGDFIDSCTEAVRREHQR